MKKNTKNKAKKLPANIKNYPINDYFQGILPNCPKCGRVALAAKLYKKESPKRLVYWCDHGRCNKDKPEKELIERFQTVIK